MAGLRDLPTNIQVVILMFSLILKSKMFFCQEVLNQDTRVSELASKLYTKKSLLVMGRGYSYATCLEGALKIKELTYLHSEGILAGELKHGPLALVDDEMPMILVITRLEEHLKDFKDFKNITFKRSSVW